MNARKKLPEKFLATIIPLACTVTGINTMALSASAATQTQDGIEATLTVVSEETGGNLDANLVVANANNFDLENVSIDFISPSGYVLSASSQIPNAIEILKAGEQRTFSVEYVKAEELPSETEEVSTTKPSVVPVNNIQPVQQNNSNTNNNNSSNSGNNRSGNITPISNNPNNSSQNATPNTGDSFPMPLLVSIAIASGIGIVLCIKKKKGKKMLSLILVGTMCGTMVSELMTIPTSAAGTFEVHSFTIEENIDVDTETLTVKVTLTYNYPSGEVKTENINFDMGNALYDEQSGTYYLFDKKNQLDGTVRDYENLKEVSYTVTDRNNTELASGELPPSGNWSIDNLGLIVGENNITVSLKYDDESTDSSTIKVNNLCEANMQSLDVDRGDDDNDGVLNFSEILYHTDPQNADSDGDTLSDYDEMAVLGTNPMEKDSDGNGVDDNAEDFDCDGLTNYDEIYVYNTNPVSIDSDGDGLSDSEEINTYHTDPNSVDTDGDEANDYWEVQNGFDPLTFDSDFGDLDPTGNGTIRSEDGTEITIVFDDAFIDEATPGYMGVNPYHIELGENESTNISIPFDSSNLSEEDAPTVYYFNEDTQRYEEVPTTITEDGQAVATVDKSGTYVLLNRRYVYDVWENDIIPPSSAGVETGNMDIVFVIDRSKSMDNNDPEGIRKQVVKEFIEKMRDQDRAAIVQFTKIAETVMPMTNDKEALINTVDSIENSDGGGCAGSDQNAGTNGSAGIRNALDELNGSTATYKYIIFLTDGDDNGYLDGYESEDAAYTALENEARDNVVIHTIGLVGTGDVDIDRLKQVADETHGNYYLATAGVEAEIAPEYSDALPLEDVYTDIESITIDLVTDSNDDGITDYYTKLICEGNLTTSNGTLVFGGASYEEVQNGGADFDGDGLLNGEEVVLMESESGVYAKVNSYPFMADSDGDGLNDYEETKIFKTSPLKFNTSIEKEHVNAMTNGDNFYSNLYLNFYNSNSFERGSVIIGNGFFGTVTDQTVLYQMALCDYLSQLDSDLLQKRSNSKYNEVLKQSYTSVADSIVDELEEQINNHDDNKVLELLDGLSEWSENLDNGEVIDFEGERIPKIKNLISAIKNTYTGNAAGVLDVVKLKELKQESERLRNLIKSIPPGDDDFYNRALSHFYDSSIKNAVEIDKINVKIDKNPFKPDLKTASGKLSVGFDIFSAIGLYISIEDIKTDELKQYCSLLANMDLLVENIYVLDSIIATTDNKYLRNAASNLKKYAIDVANNNLDLMGIKKDYDGLYQGQITMETIHAVAGSSIGQYAVSMIPYVGQVVAATMAILETIRWGGNTFFKMDKLSIAASLTIAASQTAEIMSTHYLNQLNGGNASDADGTADKWVAYSDFSDELYIYYLNLTTMRKVSEYYMKSNDKEEYVDEDGNVKKRYEDYYFNQPEEIRNGCAKNIEICDAHLDYFSDKLCDYFNHIYLIRSQLGIAS